MNTAIALRTNAHSSLDFEVMVGPSWELRFMHRTLALARSRRDEGGPKEFPQGFRP